MLALLFSFPHIRNSHHASHCRLFSPFPTRTIRAFRVYHERTSALSFLVESRPVSPTHDARRSQQLVILFHSCKQTQNLGGIRTPGPMLEAAFEGNHY